MNVRRFTPLLAVMTLGLFAAACDEGAITSVEDAGSTGKVSPAAIPTVTDDGLTQRDISGETGTDFVMAGTGTASNDAETITVDVPTGATVHNVYLYWGRRLPNPDDPATPPSDILVDGNTVTGPIIGGPIETSDGLQTPTTYRADITSLALVGDGTSSFTVEDDVTGATGASVLVFYGDGGTQSTLELWDGADWAWAGDPVTRPELRNMDPVTFSFGPFAEERSADLTLLIGDAGINRPDELDITIGATTTTLTDPFNDADGTTWDNFIQEITIPAGVSQVTVEPISPLSGGAASASLFWAAAGLSIETPPPPPPGGGEGCTPGYWKQDHHFDSWTDPYDPEDLFGDFFDLPAGLDQPEQNTDPGDVTLLAALELRGGGVNALMRHAVAALLNAASPDVDYDVMTSDVIDDFNDALGDDDAISDLKDTFEGFNEQRCPLN